MNWTVRPYGDRALLVEVPDVALAHRVASVVETALGSGSVPFGIDDVVVGLATVVVHLDHCPTDGPAAAWTAGLVAGVVDHPGAGRTPTPTHRSRARPVVEIPVVFDGPDLEEVAATVGATPAEVAELLTAGELQVAFLGFAPGFPYLVGLPGPLAGIRRRPTPRPTVPAGSVALAGGFASVYPGATPGGWMLLGRTSVTLFDPDRPPYARLRPGDLVRFRSVGSGAGLVGDHAATRVGTVPGTRSTLTPPGPRWVEVVQPGFLTLIQDGGRESAAVLGVPRAGPADPEAFVLANRLVGNDDRAAALEITVSGPTLRFAAPAHVTVVAGASGAADLTIDGLRCHDGAVTPVGSGQVLEVGRIRSGMRAYLAVAGGFDTPRTVGSRSSDVLVGLGPGPLTVGDRLGLGRPTRPHGALAQPGARRGDASSVVRVVPGPHRTAGAAAWEHLITRSWVVAPDSNRVGLRLTGPDPLAMDESAAIPSTGMVTGAIQVPPDGRPIILLPDHATVGGYPVIGCVIAADLPVLGQLGPGDAICFVEVGLVEAGRIATERERSLSTRVSGWFPTEAGT